MEHLEVFARDDDFATTMSTFITNISIGHIPVTITNYMASATLVARLKKNEKEIQALWELMGPDFILPKRPLLMPFVFVK
jgi:hypothetical protein